MGWALENSMPEHLRISKCQIVIYNYKGGVMRITRADVQECVRILESEAFHYIYSLKRFKPNESYTYKVEERKS